MAKLEKPKNLALFVSEDRSGDYADRSLRLRISPVLIQPRENGELGITIRNPDSYSPYGNLGAEVLLSTRHGKLEWEPFHDGGSKNTLRDVERVLPVLRSWTRNLEKIQNAEGKASTPGDFLVYLARALGVRQVVMTREENVRPGWGYDRDNFSTYTLGSAKYQVNETCRTWVAENFRLVHSDIPDYARRELASLAPGVETTLAA